jgi:predicted Zn-dependent protease
MIMNHKYFLRVLMVFLPACLALSCAKDYVTGKRTFNLMSESQEIALGKEADPQIVDEYGLYDDPKLAEFVNRVGQDIVRVCHRPNLQYTFRVVDSPIVNAFALPGGWVYFTRGILAHFNSEAEMAGVMGHEVGHVTARHGAEQQSKGQLAQLGLGLGSVLSEDFNRFSGIAQLGVGLLFLKFSRGQESESDRLGVEYSTRLGYNAHEMANFFRTISRLSGEGGERLPGFLSTHPNPDDREVRVNQLANEWQAKVPYQPKNLNRWDYLRMIDGIVYGEDPRQGFVENGMFYHPQLRFQFPVPDKWLVANSPRSVDMQSPEKNAGIQFTLGKGATPQQAADNFVTGAQASVIRRENARVHGLATVVLETSLQSQNTTLQVLSYFIQKDQNIFVFHGFTTPGVYSKFYGTFTTVMTGFDELRNQAALSKKPDRVRIETAKADGDLSTTLKSLGMKEEMLKELSILNGMALEERVKRGDPIKVVRP